MELGECGVYDDVDLAGFKLRSGDIVQVWDANLQTEKRAHIKAEIARLVKLQRFEPVFRHGFPP